MVGHSKVQHVASQEEAGALPTHALKWRACVAQGMPKAVLAGVASIKPLQISAQLKGRALGESRLPLFHSNPSMEPAP